MDHDDTELWNVLSRAPRRNAPAGFADSVMARIALESQEGRRGKRFCWVPWGASAAAVIGFAALVFQMFAPVSIQDEGAMASINDEVLLDSAYESLGYESLQDAVCSVSSPEMDNLGEAELTNASF